MSDIRYMCEYLKSFFTSVLHTHVSIVLTIYLHSCLFLSDGRQLLSESGNDVCFVLFSFYSTTRATRVNAGVQFQTLIPGGCVSFWGDKTLLVLLPLATTATLFSLQILVLCLTYEFITPNHVQTAPFISDIYSVQLGRDIFLPFSPIFSECMFILVYFYCREQWF